MVMVRLTLVLQMVWRDLILISGAGCEASPQHQAVAVMFLTVLSSLIPAASPNVESSARIAMVRWTPASLASQSFNKQLSQTLTCLFLTVTTREKCVFPNHCTAALPPEAMVWTPPPLIGIKVPNW